MTRRRSTLRSFIAIRAADELASQMLNVAVGWYVYAATHNPMSLAYVGLVQFVSNTGMVLLAGQAADRFDRRKLIGLSFFLQTVCLAAFTVLCATAAASVAPVYFLLIALGVARAFAAPAMSAVLPQVAGEAEFPRAVAATSSAFQLATIVGPAIGGLIYAVKGPALFGAATALYLFALVEARRLPGGCRPVVGQQNNSTEGGVLAGARFIRSHRLLLGLISLDLFAVLLGGVTALLPIYARDILAAGPVGLGCLRCAPGIGAAVVGLFLARRSVDRSAGKWMLNCVAGFGLATAVFALSTNFWLSLGALAAAGAFDMVSMVIRQTLLQTATPDAMRGRVSAVNWMFIGASSELGEFESGATAALFGVVPAALLGGLGTLAVVALWTKLFPELRGTDTRVTEKTNAAAPAEPSAV